MRRFAGRGGLGVALLAALWASGCAARWAYRQGQAEARKGNWDVAVARLTKAIEKDPQNIDYKIALENARIQASRYHQTEAHKRLAASELDKAADELDIAVKYDRSNHAAADDLAIVRDKIQKREEEKRRLSDYETMKSRAQAARVPVPVLTPRSPVPISLNFTDVFIEKIFDTLGKLAGVNILYDEGFRDKRVTVHLTNVTFEEALDQLTFVNRFFYKVLDQNTLIIVPESPTKRRSYDENIVRTFYLQNADATETANLVKTITTLQKVVPNPSAGSITIVATPDRLAFAERVIEANDKAKGEVLVEIEILEVNRTNLKDYGIRLSNYEVHSTFSPTGAAGEVDASGFTNVRAHLLSSLNLADYIVSIPSTLFAKFLQTDSNVRLLAAPRLRAAEGKKTTLKIGTEVPVPVTTFQATQTGGTTFTPATSFQYRNVGVTVDLTPKVNAAGEIYLELTAEFSLLGQSTNLGGSNLPTFLTRNVTGILRLRDGETSLIGGLVQGREAANFQGVLGLQNIPIVGNLFKSTTKTTEDTEILISITPHIVRAPRITEEDLRALNVGTEEIVRVPSARPSLFGLPEEKPSPAPSPSAAASPPAPAARPLPLPAPLSVPTTGPTSGLVPAPESAGAALAEQVAALWSPPDLALKVGETASASVIVVGVKDLLGVELVLGYDPTVIESLEVGPGPLLTLDGATVGAERMLEPGRVRAKFTRATPTGGSGAVASLKLRGLRAAASALKLESLILITTGGTSKVQLPGPGPLVVQP